MHEPYQEPWQDQQEANGQGAGADVLHSLMRFWRLVCRRQKLIAVVLTLHILAGVAYYALAPRVYSSSAKLMIVEQTPDRVATVNEKSGSDTVMATHRELVRSPVVVGAAIQQLDPAHRVDFVQEDPGDWVDEVTSRLHTSTLRKTNMLSVGYRSADPEAAAAVVSAVINAYLDFVDKTHGDTAAEVLKALTSERDQLSESLILKQREMQLLRERIGHIAIQAESGVTDPIIHRAIQLNEALVTSQSQRVELQATLATVDAALRRGEDVRHYLAVVEETVGREFLLAAMGLSDYDQQTLAEQQSRVLELRGELQRITPHLGPRHPRVVAVQQEILGLQSSVSDYGSLDTDRPGADGQSEMGPQVKRLLEQSVAQAWQREQQLAASFKEAQALAARHSGSLVDLSIREREVNRLERLHDALFEKIAAVDIHQLQGPIRVTPVEEPLPRFEPVSPEIRVVFVASVVLGFAVGLGIVYLQDLFDDRFGSPEEIASELGLPVLGMVRQLEPLPGEGLDAVQMYSQGSAPETEAFRTLRTALTLNTNVADRIAISSAEPSDGKTTISSNLAVAFAQGGKRTLVIDADLRRPGMTALMGMKRLPGVTDVLTTDGDVAAIAEQVVQRTGEERLDVIPAGPRRPNAPELLSGSNLAELLAWADANYDQVLVDCPPVLAVSDAQIVGRIVDGVVVVINPEKNHRRLVSRACDSFRSAGVHVYGVVANRISETGDRAYGYSYAYNYGHDGDAVDTIRSTEEPNPDLLQVASPLFDGADDQGASRAA